MVEAAAALAWIDSADGSESKEKKEKQSANTGRKWGIELLRERGEGERE